MELRQNSYDAFIRWLDTPTGAEFMQREATVLQTVLQQLHGSQLLLIGDDKFSNVNDFGYFSQFHTANFSSLNKKLPYDDGSFDCIVIPHCLAFVMQADLIIQELARILHGEGHIVVTSFNPFGYIAAAMHWRKKAYRDLVGMKPLSLSKFKHHVKRAELSVQEVKYFSYSCWVDKLAKLGPYLWPSCADAYAALLTKRVYAAKPIHVSWQKNKANVVPKTGMASEGTHD
tara:strand:- start:219016 stop:219705 length:690 start_codon:yes stop_codon:yes gene_type:complete